MNIPLLAVLTLSSSFLFPSHLWPVPVGVGVGPWMLTKPKQAEFPHQSHLGKKKKLVQITLSTKVHFNRSIECKGKWKEKTTISAVFPSNNAL